VKPIDRALADAARQLEPSTDTPRLDSELLMAEAFHIDRDRLILSPPDRQVPKRFWDMLERRKEGEPVAYITGRRAFWTIELDVGPGALVPRPDSETLIEAAAAHFGEDGPRRILDLGTGPGTLLLAALAEWPGSTGLGIDASEAALAYARRNAERLGLSRRAAFRLGDWTEGLAGRFDLILCNPPYVETGAVLPRDVAEWEPAQALFAGPDGLADYRRLAPALPPPLAPGGIACIELGAGQYAAVAPFFRAAGFAVASRNDLGGIERCLIATR
jgi:release factor glutamine methyltransferase